MLFTEVARPTTGKSKKIIPKDSASLLKRRTALIYYGNSRLGRLDPALEAHTRFKEGCPVFILKSNVWKRPPIGAAIIFILTCVWGCAPRSRVPGESFSAGYILSEKQSHVSHEFVVRNTTSQPVKIQKVDKTCTCTSFKLANYQLAPGESTTLTVDVDVPKSYSKRSASCVLRTDYARFKSWTYTIEFVSLPTVVMDPADLNLGSFATDGKNLNAVHQVALDLFARSKIELTAGSFTVPEKVELILSSGPEFRRLQRDVWHTRYKVSIGLNAIGQEEVYRGSRFGIINNTIQVTVSGSAKRWPFSVFWQRLAPLESHPAYLSFGNLLDDTDDHHRRITIISVTGEKFRIISIENQSKDMEFRSSADTATMATQHIVTLTPRHAIATGRVSQEPRRFLAGEIRIETSDTLQPVVKVPWSAMLDGTKQQRAGASQSTSSAGPTP